MYTKIILPDTGIKEMKVTDILVKEGDIIKKEQSIITVESDKTSIEIPSNHEGIIKKILISIGDIIHKGDIILELLNNQNNNIIKNNKEILDLKELKFKKLIIPDIGINKMKIFDILVKKNDFFIENQTLIIINNNVNTFEIASTCSGFIYKINVKINDYIYKNDIFMYINPSLKEGKQNIVKTFIKKKNLKNNIQTYIHASPIIRKMARKFNIDLKEIKPSGLKNRILKEDILKYIKNKNNLKNDDIQNLLFVYKKFGDCEEINLNNIQKISSKNLSNYWKNIPHVTQHIETDITDLEKFRVEKNKYFNQQQKNIKLTLLSFIIKICAYALKKYPNFNSSLSQNNNTLIIKKYFNIGIAINTKQGLLVPVIFDVLNKNINDLSQIIINLSYKAKNNKLHPNDMQGGCFTISNLGQFKGSFFTPIINSPEVAILGISQASIKPIWEENKFLPKLMLPLSLSYDHRVINGVEGINFLNYICFLISDIRNLLI
ncbi:pyruvate dehydrogenase [Enterobacteriaceae endosymbiont of Donacia crassipes]|uniref:2-oxo acid dehydrogenase subunit E2 n=1 Tax=Enterobacteriaceae endosymbiont of Donacia crassipes TaxID=2675776 RepID=UPI001449FBF2|nr:2-oxo acid dehydrogenase subunit E2 [Enterobacteriaceae endosymbiont of Donacia crassipes]QJC34503.1 pyruvate dehydrogenase [Enterobacteriaceae endosymbiont of Donacia crassipes]